MKEIGWDNDGVQGQNNTEFDERQFGLEAGVISVIRILSSCFEIERHWIEEKRRYILCNDNGCPACDKGYETRKSWATLILHIANIKPKKGNEQPIEKIGLTKVWMFGDAGKYNLIKETQEAYGDIRKYELRISCTDTKFQKIGALLAMINKEKWLIEKSMTEDYSANKDLLQKFTKPLDAKKVEEILSGASSSTSDDNDLLAEEAPVAKKGSTVKAAAPVAQKKQGIKEQPKTAKDDLLDNDGSLDQEVDDLLQA